MLHLPVAGLLSDVRVLSFGLVAGVQTEYFLRGYGRPWPELPIGAPYAAKAGRSCCARES
jgi:hypothetical protein